MAKIVLSEEQTRVLRRDTRIAGTVTLLILLAWSLQQIYLLSDSGGWGKSLVGMGLAVAAGYLFVRILRWAWGEQK